MEKEPSKTVEDPGPVCSVAEMNAKNTQKTLEETVAAALQDSTQFKEMSNHLNNLHREVKLLQNSLDMFCSTCSRCNSTLNHMQSILDVMYANCATCKETSKKMSGYIPTKTC